MIETAVAFTVAAILALVSGPFFARLATKVGLVDHPDNRRKLHTESIPLIGGILLFPCVTLVTLGMWLFHSESFGELLTTDDVWQIFGLGLATLFLLVVGIVDDRFGLRGRQKVIGQLIAATILIGFGYQFREINVMEIQISFGIFAVLVVYAWMLGAINSVNLLDGADGFAATIGIILCAAFAVMSAIKGDVFDAVVAASMAGALLGFLRLNFPPAKVFLGDSGSMLIGFVLGALAIRLAVKEATVYALFGPIAILAIPFLDTIAAITRRRMTGRSIYATDRGHLHHELKRKGISNRRMLFYVAILCIVTATGGVLSLLKKQSEYAIISILAVVAFLLISRLFGFAEFRLVTGKLASISRSLVVVKPRKIHNTEVRLQGEGNWQKIWNELRNFAATYQVSRLTLDLNIPWLHESFHATLKQEVEMESGENTWWSEIPVVVDGRVIGRIDVLSGNVDDLPAYKVIQELVYRIDQLRDEFRITLNNCEAEIASEQTNAVNLENNGEPFADEAVRHAHKNGAPNPGNLTASESSE